MNVQQQPYGFVLEGKQWYYYDDMEAASDCLDNGYGFSELMHGDTTSFGNNGDFREVDTDMFDFGGYSYAHVVAESIIEDDGSIVIWGRAFGFVRSALSEIAQYGRTKVTMLPLPGYYEYYCLYLGERPDVFITRPIEVMEHSRMSLEQRNENIRRGIPSYDLYPDVRCGWVQDSAKYQEWLAENS